MWFQSRATPTKVHDAQVQKAGSGRLHTYAPLLCCCRNPAQVQQHGGDSTWLECIRV